ncbi:MAG: hypothetical protein KDA37_16435 [Planctomycetales bacterium]|nr:hypothetical protein [Planctomycetales bacterium]
MFEHIARQSVTAIHFAVHATPRDANQAATLPSYAGDRPLGALLADAQAACLTLLCSSPNEGQGEAPAASTAPAKPIADYAARLYRIGTGWPGWSPSEVWNASIPEITAAYEAHVDRLVMMTPGTDKQGDTAVKAAQRAANLEAGLDPDFDRAGLHALIGRHHL